jgi:transcriptional regulator with XRE-family HTH domain
MQGDVSFEEYLAEELQDPEFAEGWAIHEPLRNLGLNVWSLRETSGMTQAQLAEAAKMKQPRIADIERNWANPTVLTISRVAFALGVPASRLLAQPDERLLARARAITAARAGSHAPRPRTPRSRTASASIADSAPRRRRTTG